MAEGSCPPVPRPAERAKTIAARCGPATLTASADAAEPDNGRVTPMFHHVHSSGTVSLLIPDSHPLVISAREPSGAGPAITLELTDPAPVPLREPVRGLVWIAGRLSALPDRAARDCAVRIAGTRPDPGLLDVGHGTTMLRLRPASLVLSDAEGTHTLRPRNFTMAEPDPFHTYETHWLRHLETDHADVITQLSRHVPPQLRDGHVRPLGLDSHGLRLRVERGDRDYDLRLAFTRTVARPRELAAELHRLVGCPFLAKAAG